MLAIINLPFCDILDDALVELGKSKSLKQLDIKFCELITDEGIDSLVKGCGSNLERLDIWHCTNLTDASLSSISDYCPNLQKITFGKSHEDMTSAGALHLVQSCQKLNSIYTCEPFLEIGTLVERELLDS